MRVLVTGSAGVVGRAVRRALSADHELILLDRWDQACDDGLAVRADVTDWRSVRAGKDVVLDRIEGTDGLRDVANNDAIASRWDDLADRTVSWLLELGAAPRV